MPFPSLYFYCYRASDAVHTSFPLFFRSREVTRHVHKSQFYPAWYEDVQSWLNIWFWLQFRSVTQIPISNKICLWDRFRWEAEQGCQRRVAKIILDQYHTHTQKCALHLISTYCRRNAEDTEDRHRQDKDHIDMTGSHKVHRYNVVE